MILDEIITYKKMQLEEEKKAMPFEELIRSVDNICSGNHSNQKDQKMSFKDSLKGERNAEVTGSRSVKIIAEIKRASPSKGIIKKDIIPADIARKYEGGGADAISVLTEKKYFLGNDEFIAEVKNAVRLPVLRKDFIVDEYQLYQSKLIGADAVLLIAGILGKDLARFYGLARSLGLDCLVEVHSPIEMDVALEAGSDIIGINNRDLRNFTVNLENTEKLIKMIPRGLVKVSESGIRTPDDVKYLKTIGVDAILIGETLMRSGDIVATLKEFKEV